MRIFMCIILLILILLGLSFALLNAEPVVINYYIGSDRLPLSLLLVYSLGIGALLGLLVGLTMYLKAKKEAFWLMHRLKSLEKEVANLRVMPLKDAH
jgi:putative membrane protein